MAYLNFASGGAPQNPDDTYETLGLGSGSGVTVTSNASANTKGAAATIGTTAAAWSEFILYIGVTSSASMRMLVDVSFDNGSTWAIQNLIVQPGGGTSSGIIGAPLPMPVAASTTIAVRMQSPTSGSPTAQCVIVGTVDTDESPPGFTACDTLNIDTTTSIATVALTVGGGFTTILDPTTAAYGAILVLPSPSTVTPSNTQLCTAAIGVGTAGNEVTIGRMVMAMTTTAILTRAPPLLIEASVASGVRLSASLTGATGTDQLRVALYGFR